MTAKKPVPIGDIDTTNLECRDLMHAWSHQTDFQVERTKGKLSSVRRILQCSRCGALQLDHYELPSFVRLSSKYVYPDNYLMPGHKGRIVVADIRREILRRFLSEQRKKS